MQNQIVNIITYGLGLLFSILVFGRLNIVSRFFYGVATHISLSILVAFFISISFGKNGSILHTFPIVLLITIWLYYFSRKTKFYISSKENTAVFISSIVLFLIFAFLINVISHSKSSLFIPIIGNNDDTAAHLAMSVFAIKGQSLIFNSSLLQDLISRGLDYQNAKFYPPSVYTYLALLYSTISTKTSPLDLPLLLNLYGAFSFFIFILFVFSIIELSFKLIRSINIWSFTAFFIFTTFFVAGEYFLILYRMSYLTQLLGTSYLLLFIRLLSEMGGNQAYRTVGKFFFATIIGIMLVGIGHTYYLFLPIAIVPLAYFIYTSQNMSIRLSLGIKGIATLARNHNIVFWTIFLLVASLPLIFYSISYSLIEQISIPGINLITLATLIQFCLMVILFVYLRKYFDKSAYTTSLVALLTSLMLTIFTTTPSMIRGGELPYYFFKSFFTTAVMASAFGIAITILIVSHITQKLHKFDGFRRFVICLTLFVLVPYCFVLYLYYYKTLIPGYKGVTYLAGGGFNYYTPQTTKKLVDLYVNNYSTKPEVYNPGYWGENILLFALFENIPQVHIDATNKKLFYFSNNPSYFLDDMVKKYNKGKEVFVFDGHGSFKPKK